jgi:hypothetical protein
VLQWLACPLVVLVGRHVALACRRLAPCLALQLPPFPPKTFPPCTVLGTCGCTPSWLSPWPCASSIVVRVHASLVVE